VFFGDFSYSNLDFADDVCVLNELLELLVPVPHITWMKTVKNDLDSHKLT